MAEKISDDVYKIPCEGNVYVYLKPEVFLIDCSDNQFSREIKTEIEKIISLSDVKKVLLTHLHYDHCGNLDLFPNAEIYASKIDLIDFNKEPNLFFLENLSEKSIEMLKHAKELSGEINGLKVIDLPGHTRGSIGLIDEKRRLLFSGDTLFINGIGRTDLLNSAPLKMNDSVEKLKKMVSEKDLRLCPGHDY